MELEFINDNMMRDERILILPYNTIRFMDVPLQMDLNKALYGKPLTFPMNTLMSKLLARKTKDLHDYNPKIKQSIIDQLKKVNFKTYYELAPRTELQDILYITQNQIFTSSITVLFDIPDMKDKIFDSAYGSIEELEKYINDNGITTLVLDDIELLYKLVQRGNVDFDYKTILLSKLGYNLEKLEFGLSMKHYGEIKKKYTHAEIALIDLFNL